MKSIILAGGGTAGHIVPHLAILPHIKPYFDTIYYIGSGKEIERTLMKNAGVKIFEINPPAFIRSFSLQNALIPNRLIKAVKECNQFIDKVKPSVVFSKGGYCALPVCFSAFNRDIPVICHESDLSLGLANKLTAGRAKALLTTFEETAKGHKNGVFVGPPIREEFFNQNKLASKKAFGITNDKPVLLITGGSQGSKAINQAVEKNIERLIKDFTVLHLYGKNNKPAYKAINGYFAFDFADMPKAISACDICISRGGSNTLFELLSTNTPTLIVPLKKGSRGDQIKNADYFKKKGALMTIDEDLLESRIYEISKELYKNRINLQEKTKSLNLNSGAKKIAQFINLYSK